MAVTIALPETIEQQLRRAWGNLDRKALEALAIEGYRAEALSAGQVAELLGLSVIETEAFLKERGVDLRLTIEDFERDRATQTAQALALVEDLYGSIRGIDRATLLQIAEDEELCGY